MSRSIVFLAGFSLLGAFHSSFADDVYRLTRTIPLGDGERWDYLTFDAPTSRVYIAHGDHVTVVDANAGSVIGNVTNIAGGSHGIAIAPDGKVGFTDDGKNGIAIAFDTHTFKTLATLKTAPDADGLALDAASRHIFEINGDSNSISVIDPIAKHVLTNIDVGAGLEAAVSDDRGHLYVDGVADHDIVVVDTTKNAVIAHYPMKACERPHGIAIDTEARRIFATCINKVMIVVNADDGTNVAVLPIGASSDGAVFDPKRKWAVSANGEGTMTVVKEQDADHFAVAATVATAPSARTIAIDPATGRIFLVAADIAKTEEPTVKGGRPRVTYAPGSVKLKVYTPTN